MKYQQNKSSITPSLRSSIPKQKHFMDQTQGSFVRSNNTIYRSNLRAMQPLHEPQSQCPVALVYDNNSQTQLFHKNIDEKRQVASLTKIMTCIVTLQYVEQCGIVPEKQYLVVSEKAASLKGTTATLQPGDRISIWDLMYGMMLPSGNDAAFCLAEGIGGKILEGKCNAKRENREGEQKYRRKNLKSPLQKQKNKNAEAFIIEMNKMAESLGMKDTRYSNPHGLADENNYSTAKDQLRLIGFCLENNYFKKIVRTKLYFSMVEEPEPSNWTREMLWENTNRLLFKGFQGIKTGNTIPAGFCLASWYKTETANLIIIVLGTSSKEERDEQTLKLTKLALNSLSKLQS